MVTEMAARIHAVWVPVVENRLAMVVRKWAYQPGTVAAMPVMALWTEVRVRLAGNRKRTAANDQYPAHTANGVMVRPIPWAAAEVATPAGRSLQSIQRRGGRGQAMRPMSP